MQYVDNLEIMDRALQFFPTFVPECILISKHIQSEIGSTDSRNIIYFISIIFLFLFLPHKKVQKQITRII